MYVLAYNFKLNGRQPQPDPFQDLQLTLTPDGTIEGRPRARLQDTNSIDHSRFPTYTAIHEYFLLVALVAAFRSCFRLTSSGFAIHHQ